MNKIKSTDLIAQIRKIASENPDYEYRREHNNCVYVEEVRDGEYEPACIVGIALVNLGIEAERLDIDKEFSEMYEDFVEEDHDLHVDWIQTVQCVQDNQFNSWSKAVHGADQTHPEVAREVS